MELLHFDLAKASQDAGYGSVSSSSSVFYHLFRDKFLKLYISNFSSTSLSPFNQTYIIKLMFPSKKQ